MTLTVNYMHEIDLLTVKYMSIVITTIVNLSNKSPYSLAHWMKKYAFIDWPRHDANLSKHDIARTIFKLSPLSIYSRTVSINLQRQCSWIVNIEALCRVASVAKRHAKYWGLIWTAIIIIAFLQPYSQSNASVIIIIIKNIRYWFLQCRIWRS